MNLGILLFDRFDRLYGLTGYRCGLGKWKGIGLLVFLGLGKLSVGWIKVLRLRI